jgi:hypothetical protein
MAPGGSLPYSQEPATCPHPEPAQSSACPPIPLTNNICTCQKSVQDGQAVGDFLLDPRMGRNMSG